MLGDKKLEYTYDSLGNLLTGYYQGKYPEKEVTFKCTKIENNDYFNEGTFLQGKLTKKKKIKIRGYESEYTETETYDEKEAFELLKDGRNRLDRIGRVNGKLITQTYEFDEWN